MPDQAGKKQLADRIDDLLPQTQCGKCSYSGCRPYAEAIAAGEAEINQCPPGGQHGIEALARLLGIPPLPLNEAYGTEQPLQTAFIIEQDCIGCSKCIPPCPVDAILGAPKHMHTVITRDCTGCELCLDPCPVDCIEMRPLSEQPGPPERQQQARRSRQRYQAKQRRLETARLEKLERARKRKAALARIKPAGRAG